MLSNQLVLFKTFFIIMQSPFFKFKDQHRLDKFVLIQFFFLLFSITGWKLLRKRKKTICRTIKCHLFYFFSDIRHCVFIKRRYLQYFSMWACLVTSKRLLDYIRKLNISIYEHIITRIYSTDAAAEKLNFYMHS